MGKTKYTLVQFILFFLLIGKVGAQPGSTIELTKPEKYENRTLKSEKTGEKKFGFARKVFTNTVSHYNYYFNADTRLNDIVERARLAFQDDYTKLLPFNNYSLDVTSTDGDIDSIIYKCNAGILLHDLRSDWVDDLYFLMGKAYFYRKDFDTAGMVFQYINYAFAKKDDGYDIPVGSNADNTGIFSVSTKEDAGFFKKLTSKPPRRNEDLIWQALNFIEAGKSYDAAGILEILRTDPNFPERLKNDLNEAYAYWYYKEKIYDSAAVYLAKTIAYADGRLQTARREFLTGQLYMLASNGEQSEKYFKRSAEHTPDPIMEVYASLYSLEGASDSTDLIQKKIDALYKLAHREKFSNYRDIIYYTAAKTEMERNNNEAAAKLLQQSIKYNNNNPVQRSLSFVLLGDVDYAGGRFEKAMNDYDSVDLSSIADETMNARVQARLPGLRIISDNAKVMHIQDSLQTVAKMPQAARDAYIKKILRQLLKEQGAKEEETTPFINPAVLQAGNSMPISSPDDVAAPPVNNAKGEWYFNNQALKSTGATTFRSVWGERPNVDNWRRLQAVAATINSNAAQDNNDVAGDSSGLAPDENMGNDKTEVLTMPGEEEDVEGGALTFESLEKRLPLTDEKMTTSNKKIEDALFESAKAFQDQLEDYPAAIRMYDSLNSRFPKNEHLEESLFNLYYCYTKTGKKFSADSARTVLLNNFKDGKFTAMLMKSGKEWVLGEDDVATLAYEEVYNLFIEGKFEQAKAEKEKADSTYGNSHWTPQLLFIESVYYISRREDSTAIEKLTALSQNGNSPLAERATTMIDVLNRRKEIEDYLTNLQITRLKDDETAIVDLNPVETIVERKEFKKDSVVSKPVVPVTVAVDTSKATGVVSKVYTFDPAEAQFAAILLEKVDPVYANETRNAFNRYNQTATATQRLTVTSVKVSDDNILVLIGPFVDASSGLAYIDKAKPVTPSRILPWLTAGKYSFTLISQSNVDVMKESKDVEGYKNLLHKALPEKF